MANNLFADVPAAVVAKSTVSFVAAGFTSSNCRIIYEVGSPLKSWVPDRDINAITGFTAGKGYYVVPSADMDMEAILIPPVPTGGGSTTPAAPTAGVVDDSADTFNWTNNPLYPDLSDYEFTLNGGTSWAVLTAKPIAVGDVNKAIGQVGVRVKAVGGDNPSAGLFNATAFNVAAGPVYLGIDSTNMTETPTGTWGNNTPGLGTGVTSQSMAAAGSIQAKYLDATDNNKACLGLDDSSTNENYNASWKFGVVPIGSLYYRIDDGVTTSLAIAPAVNDIYEIRRDSGGVCSIYINGSNVYTGPTIAGTVWGKIQTLDSGTHVSEVKGLGFA